MDKTGNRNPKHYTGERFRVAESATGWVLVDGRARVRSLLQLGYTTIDVRTAIGTEHNDVAITHVGVRP